MSALLKAIIDAVLPPRCLGTGDIVDAPGMISPAFWPQLQFIEAPFCGCCGLPFAYEIAEGALCGGCLETEPVFAAARAATVYNDASRQMLLKFKYADKLEAIHTFVPWMMRAGAAFIAEADLILPVPLHPKRLRARKFNQSALLAQELGKRAKKTYDPTLLLRTRHTPPQQGLRLKERKDNVRGAFIVTQPLNGKNVLLIDDVYTTGATLNECAKVLKAAGVEKVNVLTVARVTKEEF